MSIDRKRTRDVKRQPVPPCEDRDLIGADLVRNIAVGRHAIGADDRRVDPAA